MITTKTYPRRKIQETKRINQLLLLLLGGLFLIGGWYFLQVQRVN